MTIYIQEKILPFSSQKLFNVVIDIEKYPEFLPWCIDAEIIEKDNDKIIASITIKFKGMIHKYTSKVTINNKSLIRAVATDGPFKKLINEWRFYEINNESSKVKFFIDFEFNSFILNKMLNISFKNASHKMCDAFYNRIIQLNN